MALKYSTTHRTNVASQTNTDIGASAVLVLYNGTRPASVGTALSGNTALVTLTCNATAFGAASAGALTANAITAQNATTSGTPTFFRLSTSGAAAVIDGDVASSGADLNIPGGTVTAGQPVSISSFVITTFGA